MLFYKLLVSPKVTFLYEHSLFSTEQFLPNEMFFSRGKFFFRGGIKLLKDFYSGVGILGPRFFFEIINKFFVSEGTTNESNGFDLFEDYLGVS